MNPLMAFLLLAAFVLVSIGAARIGAWLIDRREADRTRIIHQAAMVARASAEALRHGR